MIVCVGIRKLLLFIKPWLESGCGLMWGKEQIVEEGDWQQIWYCLGWMV